jgi:hypothetical protein
MCFLMMIFCFSFFAVINELTLEVFQILCAVWIMTASQGSLWLWGVNAKTSNWQDKSDGWRSVWCCTRGNVIHVQGKRLLLPCLCSILMLCFITTAHRASQNFPDWDNETAVDLPYLQVDTDCSKYHTVVPFTICTLVIEVFLML